MLYCSRKQEHLERLYNELTTKDWFKHLDLEAPYETKENCMYMIENRGGNVEIKK